ncbi:pyrroloquinoline quinone biosynthesis protein PqqE [Phytohabitans sp. ZYX-F-186]|uniref:PqqA peptide cyclase n=1 Tax=Phytohabitans maris TaxID=3071409 RepID=A0ABU0ZCN1_9ACTN|nr:pyrroloquinoline quinone biosynthesis protein PqqE [Phytohabitans sp. ZYX-F-186]MDQ7904818.1 pyrroloquinoline quinone biosynthesis protein PqqE [Phytohabitans sp. ZYX-F-186]
MTVTAAARPTLRRGVRLTYDRVRGQRALQYPEGVLLLNETAGAVVTRCTGGTVAEIAGDLAGEFDGVRVEDVRTLVADLVGRRVLTVDGTGVPVSGPEPPAPAAIVPRLPVPTGLLAELTYRCPLRCAYCSNPVELSAYRDELSTMDWRRVLDEARGLGVLQAHFSGGEPLLRPDLAELVGHAHVLGMYTNLVTSGVPLDAARLDALVAAGLDHLQLSIQDADAGPADAFAGIRAHDRKRASAALVRASGLAFTVNAVLHAGNIDRLEAIAELGVAWGADRLELAHTQYYGWGWRNRAALMPSAAQVERARAAAQTVQARHGHQIEIVYVAADYHADRPKPCMYGWGSRQLVVAPNGDVLPCLAAGQLPDLGVVNARAASLAEIWYESPAFNRFRGTAWMPDPCRACDLRHVDFGGCRCQAYQLTGDPAATDPACGLSAHHGLMAGAVTAAAAARPPAIPRRPR